MPPPVLSLHAHSNKKNMPRNVPKRAITSVLRTDEEIEEFIAEQGAGQCTATTWSLKSYIQTVETGQIDFSVKNRDPTKIWKNRPTGQQPDIASFGESILLGSAVINVLTVPASLSNEPSHWQKRIPRSNGTHEYDEIVVDRLATPDQAKKFVKILDGGHRTMAALAIYLNKVPIKMPSTDGKQLKYYRDLSPDLKMRFDNFTVVVVKLDDCKNLHVALLKANRVNVGTPLSPGDHALMLTGMTSFPRCKVLSIAYEASQEWISEYMANDRNDGMSTLMGAVAAVLRCEADDDRPFLHTSHVGDLRASNELVGHFMMSNATCTGADETNARMIGEAIGAIFSTFKEEDEEKIFEAQEMDKTPKTSYLCNANTKGDMSIDVTRFVLIGIAFARAMLDVEISWQRIEFAFHIAARLAQIFVGAKSSSTDAHNKKNSIAMIIAYALDCDARSEDDPDAWRRAATYYSIPTFNTEDGKKRKHYHLIKGKSVSAVIDSIEL